MKTVFVKKIYIAAICAVLAVVFLNFYQKEIKNGFYAMSAPIQRFFWQTGTKTSDFFATIYRIKQLKEENERLERKNLELLSEIVFSEELKKENEALRNILDMNPRKNFQLIPAEAIGKDIGTDSILINKGSEDGVFPGMPVITPQKEILGKISGVYGNFSRIVLISNQTSSFAVKVLSDKDISGLVRGKGNFNIFLDLVSQGSELKEGDVLRTDSAGGSYPAGLLVGEISKVKKNDAEPFQQAEISPFFNIRKTDVLFVITNFFPYSPNE